MNLSEPAKSANKYVCANCGSMVETGWVHRINGEWKSICKSEECMGEFDGSEKGVVVDVREAK